MTLSTRQLEAFLTLAEVRNFTRAARAFHLSQPAFSALIRTLEETVGVRLFDRDKRAIELTVAGTAFELSAMRILSVTRAALREIDDHSNRKLGRAAVALLPSLAASWLPPLLARFALRHPNVVLEVADHISRPCVEMVLSGSVDFAIVSFAAGDPELKSEIYCTERFHLVCHKDNELATVPTIEVEDMTAQTFIHQVRNSIILRFLDAAVHPKRISKVMEVEQLSTVLGLVKAQIGITVVTSLTVPLCRDLGLVMRPLPMRQLIRTLYVVRRRGRTLSPAAQGLLEFLLENRPVEPDSDPPPI